MKTVIAAKSASPSTSFITSLFSVPIHWLNPVRILRAQEQLNKFRAQNDAALQDAGLSQADVANARLGDFMTGPYR